MSSSAASAMAKVTDPKHDELDICMGVDDDDLGTSGGGGGGTASADAFS